MFVYRRVYVINHTWTIFERLSTSLDFMDSSHRPLVFLQTAFERKKKTISQWLKPFEDIKWLCHIKLGGKPTKLRRSKLLLINKSPGIFLFVPLKGLEYPVGFLFFSHPQVVFFFMTLGVNLFGGVLYKALTTDGGMVYSWTYTLSCDPSYPACKLWTPGWQFLGKRGSRTKPSICHSYWEVGRSKV